MKAEAGIQFSDTHGLSISQAQVANPIELSVVDGTREEIAQSRASAFSEWLKRLFDLRPKVPVKDLTLEEWSELERKKTRLRPEVEVERINSMMLVRRHF